MQATITLLTPTNNRPKCFSQLEKYIAHQDYTGQLQWIVCCDGNAKDYHFSKGQKVLCRDPSQDQHPSICENMLAMIPHVEGEYVFIVEDDDMYSPCYLSQQITFLEKYDMVGLVPALYYHVPARKYRIMDNTSHTALACTGFRRSIIETVEWCCKQGTHFIDTLLWARPNINKTLVQSNLQQPIYVGLKGIEQQGYGFGHDPNRGKGDYTLKVFKQWLGKYWRDYDEWTDQRSGI